MNFKKRDETDSSMRSIRTKFFTNYVGCMREGNVFSRVCDTVCGVCSFRLCLYQLMCAGLTIQLQWKRSPAPLITAKIQNSPKEHTHGRGLGHNGTVDMSPQTIAC